MRHISLVVTAGLLLLAGCESDPYKGTNVGLSPVRTPYAVRPALGIDAADVMNFPEGADSNFRISVSVPEGNPVVTWQGLPDGASYDAASGLLKWRPGYDAANDPSDPSVHARYYEVVMLLSSDIDPVTSIRKSILFYVQDTPRPVSITGMSSKFDVVEGKAKVLATVTVSTEDFPVESLRASLKNASPGLSVTEGATPGEWILNAAYGYEAVKAGTNDCYSSWSCDIDISDALVITLPDGRKQESAFKISLDDDRQNGALSLPASRDVSGDSTFSFTAMDPNQEVKPAVTVVTSPEVGRFSLSALASLKNFPADYEQDYEISWTQIPQEAIGKTFTVTLNICTSKASSEINLDNCEDQDIELKVLARDIVTPVISRDSWETSELKYLLTGHDFTVPMVVDAGRSDVSLLTILTSSSDVGDTLVYDADDETLTITPKNPGLKVMSVQVTNSLGGSANGAFLYEVLPANWDSTLVIATPATVPELTVMEDLLGATANHAYFGGRMPTQRDLAYRDLVLVGTHSLTLPNAADDIGFFADHVKNIVISTPNLAALPTSLNNELANHDVYLAGSASQTPGGFALGEYDLKPAHALGVPTDRVSLAGTTTSISTNPAVLNVTLSSDCTRLFSLFKAGNPPTELLVGVSCPRANGGRLVVLGFEWAELRTSTVDMTLPAQWFQRMRE